MPTYEYVCGACKHHWEAFQSIKEDPLTKCPKCGKPKAKRQISAGTGFILKGGGWYSDLYASPKKSDSKASETSGESADTSTKSEPAKPDATADKPKTDAKPKKKASSTK